MVFIRKIVLILCCVTVLVAMALPTFAASDGGSGSNVRQATIPFDYITFTNQVTGENHIAEWPFNFFRSGGHGGSGSSDEFGWGSNNLTDTSFDGFFTPVGANSFTLIAESFAFDRPRGPNYPDSFKFTDETGNGYLHFNSVQITGRVLIPYLNGDEYAIRKIPFDRIFNDSGSDTNNIFYYIESAVSAALVNDGGKYYDYRMYMLENLGVKVNFAWEQEASERLIGFNSDLGPRTTLISTWFNDLPLRVESVQAEGIVSWLARSVKSFMDFELFPGLTFTKIYWFFLVILIVLWFIKLIR